MPQLDFDPRHFRFAHTLKQIMALCLVGPKGKSQQVQAGNKSQYTKHNDITIYTDLV